MRIFSFSESLNFHLSRVPSGWHSLAFAFFIGAIVIGQIGVCYGRLLGVDRVASNSDAHCKTGHMQWCRWDDIVVFCHPPNIEKFVVVGNLVQRVYVNKQSLPKRDVFRCYAHRDACALVYRNIFRPYIGKIPLAINLRVEGQHANMVDHISCWSFPGILPGWGKRPSNDFASRGALDRGMQHRDRDKSPLSGYQSLFCNLGGFVGRQKQKTSSNSQNDRKTRNDNTTNSHDKFIVIINAVSELIPPFLYLFLYVGPISGFLLFIFVNPWIGAPIMFSWLLLVLSLLMGVGR